MENATIANVTNGWKRSGLTTNGKTEGLLPLIVVLQVLICGENLLVVALVGWSSKLRELQNSFLVNLAVADCLYGAVAMTLAFHPSRASLVWSSGPVVCVIAVSFQHGTLMVSSLSVLCATVDRFLALQSPFRYSTYVTKRRGVVVIITIWCLSSFTVFSPLMFPPVLDNPEDKGNICERRTFIVTSLIVTQTVLLICAAIGLSFHLAICKLANRHWRAIQSTQIQQPGTAIRRPTVVGVSKASKMLLTITFVAVFIWTPSIALEYYHYVWPNRYKKLFGSFKTAMLLLQLLPSLASISNPWTYSFRNRDFQKALRKTLRLKNNSVNNHITQYDTSAIGGGVHVRASVSFVRQQITVGETTAEACITAVKRHQRPA